MKRTSSALLLVFLLPALGLAQERVKFPVGVSSKVLGYGHLWAAWRLKYFEREGLDVDVVLMRGTAPAVQAMIAGSISAGLVANDGPIAAVEQGMDMAMLAVPNAFQAQEAGFNVIGRVADIFPNYLLSAYSVRRSWAEKNRLRVVHFLKAVLLAKKWFERDRKAAAEFLAKEFELKPSLAEKGLDYYLTNQAWHPELDIEMDGLKTVVDIYAEQTGMKGAIPSPEKYVDMSYLKQALKELGWR